MKTLIAIVIIVVLGMAGTIGYLANQGGEPMVGSVQQGGEYHSTYTPTAGTAAQLIKSTPGTLGSIVVTGAGAGYLNIYNATTTNANLRAITATTSLPVLAEAPAGLAAGTYTFDIIAADGMLAVFTGAIGTSTITWR